MFHFTSEAQGGMGDEGCAQGHTSNYVPIVKPKQWDGRTHALDQNCAQAIAELFLPWVVICGVFLSGWTVSSQSA